MGLNISVQLTRKCVFSSCPCDCVITGNLCCFLKFTLFFLQNLVLFDFGPHLILVLLWYLFHTMPQSVSLPSTHVEFVKKYQHRVHFVVVGGYSFFTFGRGWTTLWLYLPLLCFFLSFLSSFPLLPSFSFCCSLWIVKSLIFCEYYIRVSSLYDFTYSLLRCCNGTVLAGWETWECCCVSAVYCSLPHSVQHAPPPSLLFFLFSSALQNKLSCRSVLGQ